MFTLCVVFEDPRVEGLLGLLQRVEGEVVEEFVAHGAVQAFDFAGRRG